MSDDLYQDKLCKDKDEVLIFVINLDRSTERLAKFSHQMFNSGIKFERFSAIDGNKVKVRDLETSITFTGQDIKSKSFKMNPSKMYKVNCTPDDNIPVEFDYLASVNHLRRTLPSGELGIWCSNIVLWNYVQKQCYERVIIFEDDIVVKNTTNFKNQLSSFIAHIPENYDFAYIDMQQYMGSQISIPNNPYVNKFTQNSGGW